MLRSALHGGAKDPAVAVVETTKKRRVMFSSESKNDEDDDNSGLSTEEEEEEEEENRVQQPAQIKNKGCTLSFDGTTAVRDLTQQHKLYIREDKTFILQNAVEASGSDRAILGLSCNVSKVWSGGSYSKTPTSFSFKVKKDGKMTPVLKNFSVTGESDGEMFSAEAIARWIDRYYRMNVTWLSKNQKKFAFPNKGEKSLAVVGSRYIVWINSESRWKVQLPGSLVHGSKKRQEVVGSFNTYVEAEAKRNEFWSP